tara:strand:+ start:5069 stop:5716 length:648 start_codon:yes stop_codon:yes gene_type:complete
MRHGKKFPHLGRKSGHRKYMLANMACSLIEHKAINTTLTKAKALKLFIEPIITKSKTDSTHNRRIVFRYLRDKHAVNELFREISVKIGDRPGGYTRVIKLGNRLGDNASMALIELVDYNDSYKVDKPEKRRRRRRKSSQNQTDDSVAAVEPVTDDATAEVATYEEPTVEESSSEEPAAEEPAAEEPAAEKENPKENDGDTPNNEEEKVDNNKKPE